MNSSPQVHDFSRPAWGHSVEVLDVIDGGLRLRVAGWGGDVRDGDLLILPNGGGTTRYRAQATRRAADPRDMWFADLVFTPREARCG